MSKTEASRFDTLLHAARNANKAGAAGLWTRYCELADEFGSTESPDFWGKLDATVADEGPHAFALYSNINRKARIAKATGSAA